MKIAIASNNNICSQHFGHCEGFKVYKVEENKIVKESFLESPGHKPGVLPLFLSKEEINVIIAGGMGSAAIDLFNKYNIEVVVGAEGNVEDLIKKYMNNELKSTGAVCNKH